MTAGGISSELRRTQSYTACDALSRLVLELLSRYRRIWVASAKAPTTTQAKPSRTIRGRSFRASLAFRTGLAFRASFAAIVFDLRDSSSNG
jgi:hypothetical protein